MVVVVVTVVVLVEEVKFLVIDDEVDDVRIYDVNERIFFFYKCCLLRK